MDGTLLDTQRICIPAWEDAGRRQGFERVGDSIFEVCGMNEAGWTRYLETHFAGLDAATFKRDMREYILANGKVEFKEGAAELLAFLKENGIKIALASGSSRGSIDHHLAKVRAAHYFDAIVGGNDVKNGKPAPDVFLRAAELLGVEPTTCFVFEDSANGVRAGYAAGMRCIGVPDILPFDAGVRRLLFAQYETLSQAIPLLKRYI